jgi:hypothetical protein
VYQLYRDGYLFAKKKSRVIDSLIRVLFWIAIIFGYLTLAAMANALNVGYHELIIMFAPIVVFPLGILLCRFRQESTKDQE